MFLLLPQQTDPITDFDIADATQSLTACESRWDKEKSDINQTLTVF